MATSSSWPLSLILQQRLVAIIRLDDLSSAQRLSRALLEGGIGVQEFTLSNPAALEAIASVRAGLGEFSSELAAVGVGSVRSVKQAESAIAAGAQFVVTPALNVDVIKCCRGKRIPVVPGAMTPTEILTGWESGADIVKVFPARSLGPGYIRDLLAPLPDIRVMPTGGVDLSNMQDYFSAGAVAVGIGGSLLDKHAIDSCQWNRVTALAAQYAMAARSERIEK